MKRVSKRYSLAKVYFDPLVHLVCVPNRESMGIMCRYLDINIVRHLKIQITVLNLLIVYDFFRNVTVYEIDKMMFFKTHLYFGTCENRKTTAF